MLEAAAGGHALGEAGDGDGKLAEQASKVAGGGFAFHVGTEGEDNLGWRFRFDPREEGLDAEVVGADVVRGEMRPPRAW